MIWGHYNRLQWGAQDTKFTKIPGCENYVGFYKFFDCGCVILKEKKARLLLWKRISF